MRSMVRSESLSSTSRIGGSADWRVRALIPRGDSRAGRGPVGRSPQPAGRNSRAARFFLNVGDRLLVVGDILFQAGEFGERLLAVALGGGALHGIVAVDDIGGQRIDPRLHRVGEVGVARQLLFGGLHPAEPVGAVL